MEFEADPAAEFLAREREELADIINDNEAVPPQMMSNDDFELINSEIQQADSMANNLADDLSGMSFVSTIPQKEEPQKIVEWRENTKRQLEEKDRLEQEAREALRQNAQKEMEDWVKKYNDHLQKTKSINRAAESEMSHSDMNGNQDGKNIWEQISNLCDFSSKGPKSTKDASRIRQIFLQMKTSPPTKVN